MDGILSTISTKLQAIPFRERPGLVALATSSALLLPFAIRNYFSYLKLKPAPTMAHPGGWLFSLALLATVARETKSTEEYDAPGEERASWLGEDFAWRKGDRPELGWFPGPHRQVTQWSTADIHEKLRALLKPMAAENPTTFEIRKSVLEGGTDALFVAPRIVANPPNSACRSANGEVAHVHDAFDYSLHVVLAPQDCKKVIQHGWGERHSCSGRVKGVPKEYLMIYAPRNDEELQVVKEIVRAAACFMSGGEQLLSLGTWGMTWAHSDPEILKACAFMS